MTDPIQRAYARLGLSPRASPAALRRRFRTLVRIWHPDRFALDPAGQQAATERMAQINLDYQLLTRSTGAVPPSAPSAEPVPRTLSRTEVDSLVSAIGTEGPIDQLFSELDYFYFFCRNPPRFSGTAGRLILATVLAAGSFGAFWTGWVTATESIGPDTLSWFMFAVASVLAFIAGLEVRELVRAKRFKA